jgi:hypothetical protein
MSNQQLYYKILSKNLIHRGFQYKEGLNIDTKPFDPSIDSLTSGLYFTDLYNIFYFMDYGE